MPVLAAMAPEDSDKGTNPPAHVRWGPTSVSIIGNNGKGAEIALTNFTTPAWPGIFMLPGATGLDMPSFAVFSDDSPNLDGATYRSARASAREVMLPLYLHGIDRQTINALKRQLFLALNPKRGYCILRFREGDGSTRELTAYYKGGMEGSEGTDTAGFTWARYGLTFTAMDPWFSAATPQTIRWSFGQSPPLLSTTASVFPLHLAAGGMGGAGNLYALDNPGDIESWPVWTLKGAIKAFELTSSDGRTIKASPRADSTDLVPADRTLTIDTRPGRKTVRDDLGTNYWTLLDVNPDFWQIEPGVSTATLKITTGSTNAMVTLTYYPRYASFV